MSKYVLDISYIFIEIVLKSENKFMIPLKDENPIQITPYITYGLITTNIIVFIYELILTPPELDYFFHLFAVVPLELNASFNGVAINQPVPEFMTLITAQFLHAGFIHVGFNMLFLGIFGNNIEERLGKIKYLLFYISCGVLAGLTQSFFDPTSAVPSLGASGAIAGVMGAYIIKFPQAKIVTLIPLGFFFPIFRISALWFLGFWFIQQAFNGISMLEAPAHVGMQGGGVAYWAHAGGFIFGAVLAPLFGLFSDKEDYNELESENSLD